MLEEEEAPFGWGRDRVSPPVETGNNESTFAEEDRACDVVGKEAERGDDNGGANAAAAPWADTDPPREWERAWVLKVVRKGDDGVRGDSGA